MSVKGLHIKMLFFYMRPQPADELRVSLAPGCITHTGYLITTETFSSEKTKKQPRQHFDLMAESWPVLVAAVNAVDHVCRPDWCLCSNCISTVKTQRWNLWG